MFRSNNEDHDQEKINLMEFVHDPRNAEVRAWVDPVTKELIFVCDSCGADARHFQEEFDDLHFSHEPWCPIACGVGVGEA